MVEETNPGKPASTSTFPNPAKTTEPAQENVDGDVELKAINTAVTALGQLTEEQRLRALEYIIRRFNATPQQALSSVGPVLDIPALVTPSPRPAAQPHARGAEVIHDIRTLKELKAPKSAIQMAVLVAYYVSELAAESERKKEITKHDIERYFKSGGFKLPPEASATLINAKNAGYLDSAGAGQYKLNPVGYNLVAHRLGNINADEKIAVRGKRAVEKRRAKQTKRAPRAKK